MNERPSIRTLLVEDNPTDVLLLEEELSHVRGADFSVTRAERLEDALARLEEADFDVVLLDLGLPDSQGQETLIRLRWHEPKVPIVVLTGLDDEAVGIRALQMGAQDYLIKGQFPAALLGRCLRYAIERHQTSLALRRSEARLSGLIGSAMDGIITIDEHQRITLFNPTAEQIFGCKAGEVLGQPLDRLVPKRFRSARLNYPQSFRQIDAQGWKAGGLWLIYGLHADGTEFPMEASIAQVEVAGQKLFTFILRDITERKRAEAALQIRTQALEAAANGILITDLQGTIVWANPAITTLTGYELGEVVGKNPRIFKSGQHDKTFYSNLWATILNGQVWHDEVVNQRKDGSFYTEEMTITPVRDRNGEIAQFIGIKQDVTARKVAKAELRIALDRLANEVAERARAEAELVALSHQLINAQEEERARLARDLHDNVGQQLAALGIGLSSLKQHIPLKQEEGHKEAERALRRLQQLAEDVRRMSHELHPTWLAYSGLEVALKSHCAEFKQATGVEALVQVQGHMDDDSPRLALGVLRITQEALQNVWKHSGTRQVNVDLECAGDKMRLRISDRGCGFDPSQGGKRQGLGLVSMRERAKLMGGTFAVESAQGSGTTIMVTIPLGAAQDAPPTGTKPLEAGASG